MMKAAMFGIAGRNHYAHPRNPPYWRAIDGAVDLLAVRKGVGERLRAVNERLMPAGLALFLYDAWRPDGVQRYFHDVWMPERLKRIDPTLEGAALWDAVERYWSAPTTDDDAPAPHRTGGAVDLTIVDPTTGAPLYMGGVFDDPSPLSHADAFEIDRGDGFSIEEARANRRLLFWVMMEAGFAGHPDEWWHFSYGDQLWAATTGAATALYGGADWDED
jgi:D-alanyl-D-alanine dipeptidase